MIMGLEAGIGFFSLLAAICWIRSACVKLPTVTAGTGWDGSAPSAALQRQGKWNRYAALSAGLAALCQVVELVLIHANISIGPLQ